MFEGMVAGGAPRNAVTKSDAYMKAASIYGKGDRVSIAEDTAQLARSAKISEAVGKAQDRVRFSGPYGQATEAQRGKMMADAEAGVLKNFARNQRSGSEPAKATGGPTVSNWN
jgi:hypothetical protein